MKLTKTVKYHYKLTEETLEKDLDKFIENAIKGNFRMDRHYNSEGLKMIKQYYRILQEKFHKEEYQECKICCEKLILFSINASGANESNNLFDYEDLLAKITSDFDHYIKNYFICLMKTCNIEELANRIEKYAIHLDIYGFDSDKKVLFENLSNEQLNELEEKIVEKTRGMTKKDQDKQDIIYFLMNIAQAKKNKDKYLMLCDKFKGVLNEKEIMGLKEEYGEDY